MRSTRSKKSSGKSKTTRIASSSSKRVTLTKKRGKSPAVRLVVKNVATSKRPSSAPDSPIVAVVMRALDDMKAVHIRSLDVREQTDIADTMVIASGNSDRHVRSIAERVVEFAKKAGFRPMGVEGERDGEWVLVDLQDVIVHVMLPRVREFYRLESLWDVTAARREAAGQ
jgi:ribosome-associated protein